MSPIQRLGAPDNDFQAQWILYTDGACSGNPGPGGWGAILYEPFEAMVYELGGSTHQTTNNQMELLAAIEGLRALKALATEPPALTLIYTDSKYVIQGIQGWIFGWRRNGWKTKEGKDVSNRDLWETLGRLTQGLKLKWIYVPGHAGIEGNDRVDEIAVAFSQRRKPDLYRGPIGNYSVSLILTEEEIARAQALKSTTSKSSAKKPKSGGKAYYLSLIGSELKRYETWAECEAAVKGRPGVKFKKVTSPEEEQGVLKAWGIRVR